MTERESEQKKADERLSWSEAIDDPREREERELGDESDARRDPDAVEAAESHLRRPGDDAFSDDEMVDDARG